MQGRYFSFHPPALSN